MIIIMMLVLNT